jgi:hypothetical protein
MSALNSFMAEQGYTIRVQPEEIRFEKKRRIRIGAIIFGLVFIPLFLLLGFGLPSSSLNMQIGCSLIAMGILLVVVRFNSRGIRPVTIFDWTRTQMVRKSRVFFANSITMKLEDVQGVGIRMVDLVSHSTEGVDDYEKILFVKTAKGEVDVVEFFSDQKDVEPGLEEFRSLLENYLMKKA